MFVIVIVGIIEVEEEGVGIVVVDTVGREGVIGIDRNTAWNIEGIVIVLSQILIMYRHC